VGRHRKKEEWGDRNGKLGSRSRRAAFKGLGVRGEPSRRRGNTSGGEVGQRGEINELGKKIIKRDFIWRTAETSREVTGVKDGRERLRNGLRPEGKSKT